MKDQFHNLLLGIFFFTILIACNNTTNSTDNQVVISESTLNLDTLKFQDSSSANSLYNLNNPDSSLIRIIDNKVVMPVSYRYYEANEHINLTIKPSWQAIYQINGQYHIGTIPYEIVEEGEDPCSGAQVARIESKEKAVVFFDIGTFHAIPLDTVELKTKIIQPGQPLLFTWNSNQYELRGYGKKFEDMDDNHLIPYQLNLYKNGKFIKTLVYQEEYQDTLTKITLITDFDGDHEPDFIISSPRNYEEERILIIPSSQNNISYEGVRSFDC